MNEYDRNMLLRCAQIFEASVPRKGMQALADYCYHALPEARMYPGWKGDKFNAIESGYSITPGMDLKGQITLTITAGSGTTSFTMTLDERVKAQLLNLLTTGTRYNKPSNV